MHDIIIFKPVFCYDCIDFTESLINKNFDGNVYKINNNKKRTLSKINHSSPIAKKLIVDPIDATTNGFFRIHKNLCYMITSKC